MRTKDGAIGGVIKFAETALKCQIINDGDYFNEEGLLVCGKCGEQRQKYITVDTPTELEPEKKISVKVVAACKCEKEKIEAEIAEEKNNNRLEKIKALKKASLMDEKFTKASFDGFVQTDYNARNLKLCKRYATAFDKMLAENQGLLMWGGVGTGKSYAAACIANHLLSQGVSVVMTSFVKLLEMIQSSPDRETEIIEKLNKASLVIFDDLGAERSTDYALEKVYNVVDRRYSKNLPMIYTTNLTFEEMRQEENIRYKRIYDRIFENCYPMQFTGPSWRAKAAYERFNAMAKFADEMHQ